MFQSLIGRLKTGSVVVWDYAGDVFQSLIGRLKTEFLLRASTREGDCFNPS